MHLPPDLFQGEVVHILGGGPSLNTLEPADLGLDAVIAVNNAGLDFFPDADILFVMDRRWWTWNRSRLDQNRSEYRVARQFHGPEFDAPWPVIEIGHDKFGDLSESHDRLAGTSGGAMALNLAYLLGAATIFLHGFDMRPTGNYHEDHQIPTHTHLYESEFIPSLERMAARLAGKCTVINATPDSALKCFPTPETAPHAGDRK